MLEFFLRAYNQLELNSFAIRELVSFCLIGFFDLDQKWLIGCAVN